jgi:hypothetical protein
VLKATRGNPVAGRQNSKDGEQMPDQFHYRNRHVGDADRGGHQLIEHRSLKFQGEKVSICPEESRVQIVLNGSQIHTIILSSWMVSGDQNAQHGKRRQKQRCAEERLFHRLQ